MAVSMSLSWWAMVPLVVTGLLLNSLPVYFVQAEYQSILSLEYHAASLIWKLTVYETVLKPVEDTHNCSFQFHIFLY